VLASNAAPSTPAREFFEKKSVIGRSPPGMRQANPAFNLPNPLPR